LKQGIWMMSFIGGDCLDLAPGSIPKRWSALGDKRVGGAGAGRAGRG